MGMRRICHRLYTGVSLRTVSLSCAVAVSPPLLDVLADGLMGMQSIS
jgi:hypothetical protein